MSISKVNFLTITATAALAALGVASVHAEDGAAGEGANTTAPTIDTNDDGKADAWDKNGDGKADAWDTDGDGKPDAWDKDGDGQPDPSDVR